MKAPFAYRRDLTKKLMRHYVSQWEGLPMPRLQLRWANKPVPQKAVAADQRMADKMAASMGLPSHKEQKWDCFYEMVLPVDKYDIRNEYYEVGFIIIPISWTRRGNTAENLPCSRQGQLDTPYRDCSHAFWDSKALGWPPIFVVAPDGVAAMKADYPDQPMSWPELASAIEARRAATLGAVYESAVAKPDAQPLAQPQSKDSTNG
jgi:hypothetical protein